MNTKLFARITLFTMLFLVIATCALFAQAQVTIIDKGIYISHYCIEYKSPLWVEYKLYKTDEGHCTREKMAFRFDKEYPFTAKPSDFANSGYELGHMLAAEDGNLSNLRQAVISKKLYLTGDSLLKIDSCMRMYMTFRMYNVFAQTGNLNKGIWKTIETKLRTRAEKDSLYVIAGGVYKTTRFIGNHVRVPDKCFKVAQLLASKKVIFCGVFTNLQENNRLDSITVDSLERLIGYKIPLK